MDDTISRQAAIDICNFAIDFWRGQLGEGIVIAVRKRIEQLPSVQSKIIRCKECRHRIVNDHYGEKGYLKIKGYCELDTGDPFELGRDAGNDDWFCADAERRTDERT